MFNKVVSRLPVVTVNLRSLRIAEPTNLSVAPNGVDNGSGDGEMCLLEMAIQCRRGDKKYFLSSISL